MKIGIVTFVKADNYGAELQAYALQKKLNMMGYDAEVLDLEKEQGVMSSSKRNIYISLKNRIRYYGFWRGCNKFIQAILETLSERQANKNNLEQIKAKHKVFEQFFDNKIKHSPEYIKLDDLANKNLPYDIYIAGSDQIWNYMQTNRLDVFFLKFANRFHARKISYAASFSVPSIPKDLETVYKTLIDNLDAISVRENNALEIVSKLSRKNVVQVLDPTLLLNRSEWVNDVAKPNYLFNLNKVVVIYTLSGSKYIYELAKGIAKKLDADVVNIKNGFSRVKGDDGIIHIMDAGPQEFISLLNKAVYVITDSFHGTAFSINFNIPFTTLLNPVSNINSRALSLLEMCKLTSRMIYDDGNNAFPKTLTVDFTEVNETLAAWREKSIDYLITNIHQ